MAAEPCAHAPAEWGGFNERPSATGTLGAAALRCHISERSREARSLDPESGNEMRPLFAVLETGY